MLETVDTSMVYFAMALKLAIFLGVIGGLHWTYSRDALDLYKRVPTLGVAVVFLVIGAMGIGFTIGPCCQSDWLTRIAGVSDIAIAALALGLGLLIQVIRFWRQGLKPNAHKR